MLDEISLPPLPNDSNAIGVLNKSHESGAIDIEETEEILQNHYAKLQSALLDSYDAQKHKFESEINQASNSLKKALEEKIEIGAALYQTKGQVGHLNRTIAKT